MDKPLNEIRIIDKGPAEGYQIGESAPQFIFSMFPRESAAQNDAPAKKPADVLLEFPGNLGCSHAAVINNVDVQQPDPIKLLGEIAVRAVDLRIMWHVACYPVG